MHDEEYWMEKALEEAGRALEKGEVPVGSIVILEDRIIGRGHNRTEETSDPLAHAEILALREAAASARRWSLSQSSVYVTVEPCIMCLGAMLIARIPKLVYGAKEPRTGACESVLSIPIEPSLKHRIAMINGIKEEECRAIMQAYFKKKRLEGSRDGDDV